MTDDEGTILTRKVDRLQTVVRVLGEVLIASTHEYDRHGRTRIRNILQWGLSGDVNHDTN
jgi:hypothetical protein